MKWSTQNQLKYGLGTFLFFALVIFIPYYIYFINVPPTCFDNKQNQDERGVDCGGVCTKACKTDAINKPIVVWARAFLIANGKYNLVAYLQNPNVDYVSNPFPYTLNVFDENNTLIGSRDGVTSVPYEKGFVVFEQAFDAGERKINKVTFDIQSDLVWNKTPIQKSKFDTYSYGISNVAGTPTLKGTMTNKTSNNYSNFYVVAIVYGLDGNVLTVSRTLVDELRASGKVDVVFSWPNLSDIKYSKVEILPSI